MIVDKLYSDIAQPRYAMTRGSIRMSLAGACTRREGYSYLKYPEDQKQIGRQSAAAKDGDLHENDIIERMKEHDFEMWNHGRDNQLTVHYTDKFGNNWLGHPDLFTKIDGDNWGVDVKGFRTEVFQSHITNAIEIQPGVYVAVVRDFDKRPYSVIPQMQLYLHSEEAVAQNVKGWIIVMKDKNDASIAEVIVYPDDAYLDKLVTNWRDFWSLMSVKRLPKRNFEFDSQECHQCPFFQTCWKKELLTLQEIKGHEILDDSVSVELADKGLYLQNSIKDLSAEFSSIKMYFAEKLLDLKTSSIYIPVNDSFVHVSVSRRERISASPLGIGFLESQKDRDLLRETEYPVISFREAHKK